MAPPPTRIVRNLSNTPVLPGAVFPDLSGEHVWPWLGGGVLKISGPAGPDTLGGEGRARRRRDRSARLNTRDRRRRALGLHARYPASTARELPGPSAGDVPRRHSSLGRPVFPPPGPLACSEDDQWGRVLLSLEKSRREGLTLSRS